MAVNKPCWHCKHSGFDTGTERLYCVHPKVVDEDPNGGKPFLAYCRQARSMFGKCGSKATYFTLTDKKFRSVKPDPEGVAKTIESHAQEPALYPCGYRYSLAEFQRRLVFPGKMIGVEQDYRTGTIIVWCNQAQSKLVVPEGHCASVVDAEEGRRQR